ncbi:hypothetical protein SOASR030_13730 [Leminorella grimontii]|uniref:Uncharacterized protein n=1 Tax=Leminorella grimontii TaxID=82981 RepID=A0AAV5N3D8_9GAMM|nr:hypothetical protein SOASR030_13730 [Leminorella grimontii]
MHNSDSLCICRVCGAAQLEPPWGDDGDSPNYDICDCCGAEFGYEDASLDTLKVYRAKWLGNGANWNHKKSQPDDWSLEAQLSRIPQEYR